MPRKPEELRNGAAKLTAGGAQALRRLHGGDTLEQKKTRTKICWASDGSHLHHLTFKNLCEMQTLKRVKSSKRGFEAFGLSAKGKAYADEVVNGAAE